MNSAASVTDEKTSDEQAVKRIQDLLWAKSKGQSIVCNPRLELIPADFFNKLTWERVRIFVCRFSGSVAGTDFSFRKCYGRTQLNGSCRGGTNAVMTANRFLEKDYHRLQKTGIKTSGPLFSLQDLLIDQNLPQETGFPPMTIYDFIYMAEEGNQVIVEVDLDTITAIEHYPDVNVAQNYLMADFTVIALGNTSHCQRCLASYPAIEEDTRGASMMRVANNRLQALYRTFKKAGIEYNISFFSRPLASMNERDQLVGKTQ